MSRGLAYGALDGRDTCEGPKRGRPSQRIPKAYSPRQGAGRRGGCEYRGFGAEDVASKAQLVQPVLWSPVPCRTVNLVD